MTTTAMFTPLIYANKLKKAGFTEEQAEIQAEALAELVDEKLATKEDIHALRIATKSDLQALEQATKRDLQALEQATKRDLHELEDRITYKLTLRLGTMIAATITILATLMKIH